MFFAFYLLHLQAKAGVFKNMVGRRLESVKLAGGFLISWPVSHLFKTLPDISYGSDLAQRDSFCYSFTVIFIYALG